MRTSASSSSGAEARRLAVLLVPVVLPWTIISTPNGLTYVFAWGLVNPSPLAVTTVVDYVFVLTQGLPDYLLAWPTSTLLYVLALANVALGRARGIEDVRVTAGLLAIAGVAHAWFALSFGRTPGVLPIPLGVALLWAGAAVSVLD